jgi:hypothetical protein
MKGKGARTEDGRKIEETESQRTDQSWTRECQGIIEIYQLQYSPHNKSTNKEPTFRSYKLILSISRSPPVQR